MNLPITGISITIDTICMLLAWWFLGKRLAGANASARTSMSCIRMFFLHMALFFLIMGLPHLALIGSDADFSLMMGIGYTIGHIFLYIAYYYLWKLLASIVPAIHDKRQFILPIWVMVNVAVTALTGYFSIYQQNLTYDPINRITDLNASPLVGAAIGIVSMATFLPVAILLLVGSFRNHGAARLRSLLMGSGFAVVAVSGPLHDVANTWQMFLVADVLTILSILLITLGVLRFGQESGAVTAR